MNAAKYREVGEEISAPENLSPETGPKVHLNFRTMTECDKCHGNKIGENVKHQYMIYGE